jgi:hypothetical protein
MGGAIDAYRGRNRSRRRLGYYVLVLEDAAVHPNVIGMRRNECRTFARL